MSLSFDVNAAQVRTNLEASFTRTINVTVIVTATFDFFDGHFDGENGCTNYLVHQSVHHH